MRFEWDAAKARANLSKHGVTFEDASSVFDDPFRLIFADPDHSIEEDRFIIVGGTTEGVILVVSSVERRDSWRLISARKATRFERESYEQEI